MSQENKNSTRGLKKRSASAFGIPRGNSWFFGIGIDEYVHFSPLKNAVKDVKDLIHLLHDQYGFHSNHILTLFDKEATRDNIIDRLDDLTKKVGPIDKLLLYYSGHGHLDMGTDLAYWIPQDASKGRTSSYIPNSTVRDYLKAIPSLHTLLISDSCFSGALFVRGASRSDEAVEELEKRRSRWGIVSGRRDEEVCDGAPGTNSPFAASILRVLEQNRHAKLNVARLADQVVEITRSNYEQLPEGNPLFGVGHDGGQYVFRLLTCESNLWERCVAEHSLAAYNDYLDQFPEGANADKALQRIRELEEEREWEKAGRIDRIYAYRIFLKRFKNGKYAEEAGTCIRRLQEEAVAKERLQPIPVEKVSFINTPGSESRLSRGLTGKFRFFAAGIILIILAGILGIYLLKIKPLNNISQDPLADIDLNTARPEESIVMFEERVYKTIQFEPGGLIWLAQNLDVDVNKGSWYFDTDPKNGEVYGRLYTWTAAKAACEKEGWRLPTNDELEKINKVDELGNPVFEKLFDPLDNPDKFLGGYRRSDDGKFFDLGSYGGYWTANAVDADKVAHYIFRKIKGKDNVEYKLFPNKVTKEMGWSCLCVKD